ncbi:MAG TPA: phosphoglycerate mutase [Xanthomonadaceae bacterium]|nr:phosphoglycerate mutase [Xanthomonadaceae bacterium]
MAAAPATATLLLPARARLAGAPLPERLARALGRADRLADGDPGERAQLLRHFELLPRSWPVAALTRQRDAGDAAGAAWLRADPAYVRPDINGVRLLGIGESLQLAREDADALLPALRPLFGDAGFPIDAPDSARWYLRLPREARLPLFADAGEVLGADLFDHLPDGPEGRRWRALLSEAQVVLHNHPHNALRGERGLPPVNSLWFWGGGALPDHVRSPHAQVRSDDLLLRSLALAAGIDDGRAMNEGATAGGVLLDYRALAAFDDGLSAWVDAAVGGQLARLVLDFADGARWAIARPQRWRIWRRPLQHLAG